MLALDSLFTLSYFPMRLLYLLYELGGAWRGLIGCRLKLERGFGIIITIIEPEI